MTTSQRANGVCLKPLPRAQVPSPRANPGLQLATRRVSQRVARSPTRCAATHASVVRASLSLRLLSGCYHGREYNPQIRSRCEACSPLNRGLSGRDPLSLPLRRIRRPTAILDPAHQADGVVVELKASRRGRNGGALRVDVVPPEVDRLELHRRLRHEGLRVTRPLHRQPGREVRSQRDHRGGVRVILRIPSLLELTARIPVVHVAVAGIVDVRAAPVVLDVRVTGEAARRVDADVRDASRGEVDLVVAIPLLPIHPREGLVGIVNGVHRRPVRAHLARERDRRGVVEHPRDESVEAGELRRPLTRVDLIPRLDRAVPGGERRDAMPPGTVRDRPGLEAVRGKVARLDRGEGRARDVIVGVEIARANALDAQFQRVGPGLREDMRHGAGDRTARIDPDAGRAIGGRAVHIEHAVSAGAHLAVALEDEPLEVHAAPTGALAGASRRDATRSGAKCTAVASVTTSARGSPPSTTLCTCSGVPCGSVPYKKLAVAPESPAWLSVNASVPDGAKALTCTMSSEPGAEAASNVPVVTSTSVVPALSSRARTETVAEPALPVAGRKPESRYFSLFG